MASAISVGLVVLIQRPKLRAVRRWLMLSRQIWRRERRYRSDGAKSGEMHLLPIKHKQFSGTIEMPYRSLSESVCG